MRCASDELPRRCRDAEASEKGGSLIKPGCVIVAGIWQVLARCEALEEIVSVGHIPFLAILPPLRGSEMG
eukprot:4448491-Amphidinium_carterae.1